MMAGLFVPGGSPMKLMRPNELLKHTPGKAIELNMEAQTRISLLIAMAIVVIGTLVIRRLVTGIPFLPPADYRSFTIVNKKDFVELYGAESLPSKAPIERLEGNRRTWALLQLIGLISLVILDVVLLVSRIVQKRSYIEEAVELAYWTIFLGLHAFRFYLTPYRPIIFLLVTLGYMLPLILLFQRDIWLILLFNPPQSRIDDARFGWGVYARLALSSTVAIASLLTPRQWYPVDPYSSDPVSPEQTASISNYLSYNWIQRLVVIAWSRDVQVNDLPPVPDYDRARLWSTKYKQARKSNTLKTMFALFRYDFIYMILFSFAVGVLQFIWPISMRELLEYIEKSKTPEINPWVWVFGLFFGPIAEAAAYQGYIFNSTRLIIRIKAAFTQALLQKTLKIRFTNDEKQPATTEKGDNKQVEVKSKIGMINNLMSSDLQQLADAREFFMLVGTMPIEIILSMFFLYDLLGWSSLVGVALMLVTMVVPVLLARTLAGIQRKLRQATDARVGLMVEAMNSIRIIKFFGMEKPFLGRIREKRDQELRLSFIGAMYNLGFHTISTLLPILNMLVSFGLFTKVMGKPLTASIAFTSISLFNILRSQFVWMAYVSQEVLYAFVSFDRIDKFLSGEEELEQAAQSGGQTIDRPPYYKDATLSWCIPGSEDDNNFRLHKLDIECVPGALTVIAGPVGSGKSSFLLGLLGEMRLLKGKFDLPRNNGIAYAAQSPWLQCDTISNNILFGSEYNQARYDEVVEACGLSADLKALDAGDQTEIGERGVSLSGGQKARIALARAVYSPAQIVLLDDVLSALDAGTAKLVVEKCLKGDILAGRTVVLVTHNLSLIASIAKKIIVLEDGCIVSDCAPQALTEDVIEIIKDNTAWLGPKTGASPPAGIVDDVLKVPVSNDVTSSNINGASKGKLVKDETYGTGRIPKRIIWEYLKNYGGSAVLLLLMTFNIANQFGGLANQYYVALWSDEYTNHPDSVNVNLWLGLYAAVLIGVNLLEIVTYGTWFGFQWLASRRLHDKLVKAVLRSPIRFFDTTPIGRIINRLSNDVRSIDSRIGQYLLQFIMQCLEIVFRVVVMSSLIPAFLVPTLFVSIMGLTCGLLYVRAQIGVKRIISVKESPLMSHFADTISGILTIRAFSCQDRFLDENMKRIDDFSQPNEAFFNLNRWIGIRISWCTAIIGGAAGVIALTSKGYTPGLIGFSMANALAFSSSVLSGVRYLNALEVELNSYERVDEWVKLPPEEIPSLDKEPPAAWPTQGDVRVQDLSVRYTEDGPDVLHKVSFDVKPRERIGVVGRTGAGKSSLALTLLRFTHISSGSIAINGIDIKNINLEALRRRITIIPQDPVLFSGTIRSNLDPFNEMDDTELQVALEGCGLVDAHDAQMLESSTPTGTKRITLDTPITTGGENLSQGQRQLLAFARGALVRRSKLVILDEATSSTDMKTDERIRQTFNTNGNFLDSSFIMIAHRLRTVMQFDRILVLDNKGNGGEVVEFDTPLTLLQNKDGILHSLAQKSGEFEELLAMAKHDNVR